jgi:hypothetical protein
LKCRGGEASYPWPSSWASRVMAEGLERRVRKRSEVTRKLTAREERRRFRRCAGPCCCLWGPIEMADGKEESEAAPAGLAR